MIKCFKKELDSISFNDKINEKLMIFSLYNEFYNYMLSASDDSFIEHYGPFMENTFELVGKELNLKENESINAIQFMEIYLQTLSRGKLSSMSQVESVITTFKGRLNEFMVASGYVNVIEQFESIPLDVKVGIMAQFRQYINNMFCNAVLLYGEENSKDLRFNILDMLSVKLEYYLKKSVHPNSNLDSLSYNLKSAMVSYTKEYLMGKLENSEFEFVNIQHESTRKFFPTLNKTEQKIWLMEEIYSISGYDESNTDEKIGEICNLLKISKVEYMHIIISMVSRATDIIHSADDSIGDNRQKKNFLN